MGDLPQLVAQLDAGATDLLGCLSSLPELSKADKLSRQEQTKALRSVKAEVATWGDAELYSVQLFSSLKKTGVEEAERVLAGWLDIEIKANENKRPPDKGGPGAKMP